MTSHVFNIVVDNPTVKKVLSKQTIVQKVIVGSSASQISLPDAVPQANIIAVGASSATKVISNQTLIDRIIIGSPPPKINTLIKYGLDSGDVFSLVDSDYVTTRVGDVGIDSVSTISLITTAIDSAYINTRVDPAVDSYGVFALIDSDYINARVETFVPNLVWETEGDLRINTGWIENDTSYVVRRSQFNASGLLQLELASFSPTVSANGQSLTWDTPASTWAVSVSNPDDFPSQYVASVAPLLKSINGIIDPDVGDYTSSGPSLPPAGTVDWTQSFTTNAISQIYSNSSNHTGGSASATVEFNNDLGSIIPQTATISFNWSSVSNSISMSNLSGKTFLQTYTSTAYNVSTSGISNNSNRVNTVTATGGSVSNVLNSGTFTFTNPIHKDNNGGRSVQLSTAFTRPVSVSGTEYTTTRTASDTSLSASFTYPSFHILTNSTSNPPTRADVVVGSTFTSDTTVLGNQSRTISGFIENATATPKAFYFAVRSSATQPTNFQTGASAALLSTVAAATGQTILMEPDDAPAGYVSETYNLYGITLQPGSTYVSIN